MKNLLLDGRTLAQKIEEAKKLLIDNGYLVRKPIGEHEVETAAQLVRFFYDTMARYNPQFKMVYAGNLKKERAIAKKMIEARMSLGSSRKRAVSECCELIKLLFEYEEHIGLSFKVTSMGVFGLDTMSWVTEKVWQIHEGVNRRINSTAEAEWFDKQYKNQENLHREEELERAREMMDKVLERYEDDQKEKES